MTKTEASNLIRCTIDVVKDKFNDDVLEALEMAIKALEHTWNCKNYFEVNSNFKAHKLPASYGFAFRKYYGTSARAFKNKFEISVSEAIKISRGDTDGNT